METLLQANRALWIIAAGTTAALIAAIYVPVVANVFRFAALPPATLALCAAIGAASVLWFDAYKLVQRNNIRGVDHDQPRRAP